MSVGPLATQTIVHGLSFRPAGHQASRLSGCERPLAGRGTLAVVHGHVVFQANAFSLSCCASPDVSISA